MIILRNKRFAKPPIPPKGFKWEKNNSNTFCPKTLEEMERKIAEDYLNRKK